MRTERFTISIGGTAGPYSIPGRSFAEALVERWLEQTTVTLPFTDSTGKLRHGDVDLTALEVREMPSGAAMINGELDIDDDLEAEPPPSRVSGWDVAGPEIERMYPDGPPAPKPE